MDEFDFIDRNESNFNCIEKFLKNLFCDYKSRYAFCFPGSTEKYCPIKIKFEKNENGNQYFKILISLNKMRTEETKTRQITLILNELENKITLILNEKTVVIDKNKIKDEVWELVTKQLNNIERKYLDDFFKKFETSSPMDFVEEIVK
jgi:hypothetical protein